MMNTRIPQGGMYRPQTQSSALQNNQTGAPPQADLTQPTQVPQGSPGGGMVNGGANPQNQLQMSQILQSVMQMLMALLQQLGGAGQQSPMTGALADQNGEQGGGQGSCPGGSGSCPGSSGNTGNTGNTGNAGNTGNTGAPESPGSQPTSPTGGGGGDAEQQQFLGLINKFRAENGLQPVKLNDQLNQTAQDYSKALNDSGQFTHELNGTQFGDRIKQHGYNMGTGTENIAKGQQSVQDAFNSWVESPGHRANLLNPDVKEIGLGHAGDVWTQEGAAPG